MNKRARFDKVEDYLEQFKQQPMLDLVKLRRQAATDLAFYGFPGLKTEAWKYTNSKPLLQHIYTPAADKKLDHNSLASLFLQNAYQLVFVNGFYHADLSTLNHQDVVILPLTLALKKYLKQIEAYLGKLVPLQQPGFAALNTMLFRNGYFLQINAVIDKPLHILHIKSGLDSEKVIYTRNLIMLQPHSTATVMEHYIALDDAGEYWRNNISEVVLFDQARLDYYKLQNEAKAAKHTDFIGIRQHAASCCQTFNLDLGGKLVRNDLQIQLTATGAECELNGLYLAKQGQHIDNHTAIEHTHGYTYAKEYYKGILAEKSRAVFNGRVMVHQDAQKIKSAQKNVNLLLANDAEVDTKPELEIYADDVICTHGATVGQLSQKAIFYLQSRGIDAVAAKKILTFAFAEEVVGKIKHDIVRQFIARQLATWFAKEEQPQEMRQ